MAPLWVIDFPMFEDDGEGGLTGALRLKLGKDLSLTDESKWRRCG